jgi:hypothetical protein
MPVYVDPLTPALPSRQWPFRFYSHMIADTTMELHNMARRIGLKPEWYQTKSVLPHYDLSPARRQAALRMGAIAISKKEIFLKVRKAFRLREKAS